MKKRKAQETSLSAVDEALTKLHQCVSDAIGSALMPDKSDKTLGEFIKERRAALGMSLDDVAKAAGCTKPHVWALEQDRSRNPTISMVWGLSKALSVPFSILAAAAIEIEQTRQRNKIT